MIVCQQGFCRVWRKGPYMNLKIKAVAAYYTPSGVVADSPRKPEFATYREEKTDNTYTLTITAEYAPAGVSVRIPVETNENSAVFMNGFQSATESKEYSVTEKMSGLDAVSTYVNSIYSEKVGGDYSIVKYKNKPGIIHGFSYCYFRDGDKLRLFASLDESTGYTVFQYDAATETLNISKDIEGVKSFNEYKAISIFFSEGSEDEVFDSWFEALGKKDTLPAEPLIGYSTEKLSEINEDLVIHKLNAVKHNFPVKPNIFILDGDFCVSSDWLKCDTKKFPAGLRQISDAIKSSDMISGICISPFTVEEGSSIYTKHKDWLLICSDGRHFKTKKDLYVLDTEKPEVRAYVRDVIHTILYMWGFDMIKLNNLYVAGLIASEGKSRGEKMCSAMTFLRECCGGKLMYTDHTPLMPAFGLADYCAISCDAVVYNVSAAYSRIFYRESASVRNASADIVFRRALNRRAFLNAPCSVSLDDKESFLDGKLNSAEQNVLTNLEGLFTSVIITTDSTASYNQKKKRRFKQMCSLGKEAKNVTVTKANKGFIVGYKLDDRSYTLKFR